MRFSGPGREDPIPSGLGQALISEVYRSARQLIVDSVTDERDPRSKKCGAGEDARFTMADCHAKIVKGGLATEFEDDF